MSSIFEDLICIKGNKCKLLKIEEKIYYKKPYFDARFSVIAQNTALWCNKPNKDNIPKLITTLITECDKKVTTTLKGFMNVK